MVQTEKGLSLLRIYHLRKAVKGEETLDRSFSQESVSNHSIYIETCLRKIIVTRRDINLALNENMEVMNGIHAYEFLLRTACGLESEVIGETDIFGQMKEALFSSREKLTDDYRDFLNIIMQRLFEDTKEIRTQYVQNIGGSSYGSLVRKMIQDSFGPLNPKKLLLIGAGKLSKSVLPWLIEGDRKVHLFNRSYEKAIEIKNALKQGKQQVEVHPLADELKYLKNADVVIYCIPSDIEFDLKRLEILNDGKKRLIIHLGLLNKNATSWNRLSSFYSLDEVFNLQEKSNEKREIWIARANAACSERARLRALGGSLTLAHGWEDLAVFA